MGDIKVLVDSTEINDGLKEGESFMDSFEIVGRRGTGSFSVVDEVRSRKTGSHFALKRSKFPMKGPQERKKLLAEVEIARDLGSHPCVVDYHGAWQEQGYLYILMELCFFGAVSAFREPLPESTIWRFLRDMGSALQHMHNANYVHNDVKLENIFISNTFGFKLGDLGISRKLASPVVMRERRRSSINLSTPARVTKVRRSAMTTSGLDISALHFTPGRGYGSGSSEEDVDMTGSSRGSNSFLQRLNDSLPDGEEEKTPLRPTCDDDTSSDSSTPRGSISPPRQSSGFSSLPSGLEGDVSSMKSPLQTSLSPKHLDGMSAFSLVTSGMSPGRSSPEFYDERLHAPPFMTSELDGEEVRAPPPYSLILLSHS